ncbi:site-specific integrase [Marinifilum flexuosum]|uniref:Site-specific recombinase XerD n=1 Tax=Marinifilum flexuosum TaxID=1117708 RepID=A0A419WMS7_9BACT|nr:site-specific integrase [Marinifilum flexuosum]RKD96742.1 site-specific recombinase XerD [Marinifilum flexuosum]
MSASYKFVYNRKGKLNSENKALVQLRVYMNRKQKFFTTGEYLRESQWDDEKKKIVNHPNAIKKNKKLRDMISSLEDYEIRIMDEGKKFTFEHVEQFLSGDSDIGFIEWCRKNLEEKQSLKGSTYRAITGKLNVIERTGILTSFKDLTFENILKLDNILLQDKAPRTVFKYHSVLKTFVSTAIKMDLLAVQNNPYIKFQPKRVPDAKRRYLDETEVRKLQEKDFSTKRLREIRDVFLFSVYSGLSYADICDMKKSDLYIDHEGNKWIWRDRVKTDFEYKVPLLPQAAEIIERYADDGCLLPVKSNQKMNEYLKEIATICEIDKNLTFHMARHTFATTITLSNDVPISTVSRMMGHSSLRTTQIYAKIVDTKMLEDMNNLREKMKKSNK